MKIIIIGAGELGKYLASTLSHDGHDIVVIEQIEALLRRLRSHLDVMTIHGNGANIECLKKAGIQGAEVIIAVSGDESVNIVSCQLASHMGVKNTICRLNTINFFSEDDHLSPRSLDLHNVVIPAGECVQKIMNVLDNKIIVERILFSNPEAIMTAFEVLPSSPIAGARLKDIANPDLLDTVRFAAVLRDRQHIIPHGDTIIVPGDKVYVAGHREKVASMVRWNSPDNCDINHVAIAGATRIGKELARRLFDEGYNVRLIEKDFKTGAHLLDDLKAGIMVINGDPTDKEVLIEAGVDACDAFVSALDDDEDNILSCIMAKELGAKKVVTVTNKAEYVNIIPAIDMIDSGFSSSLVAVNTVLRQLDAEAETVSVDAILNRIDAYVFEFKVHPGSQVCGKYINEIKFPLSTVLAVVFRKGSVISAAGSLKLEANDTVATVTTYDKLKALEPLFEKKGFLNL